MMQAIDNAAFHVPYIGTARSQAMTAVRSDGGGMPPIPRGLYGRGRGKNGSPIRALAFPPPDYPSTIWAGIFCFPRTIAVKSDA
jgi:hypothetical protein